MEIAVNGKHVTANGVFMVVCTTASCGEMASIQDTSDPLAEGSIFS